MKRKLLIIVSLILFTQPVWMQAQNAAHSPASPLGSGQGLLSSHTRSMSKGGAPIMTPSGYPAGFLNSMMLGTSFLINAQSSSDGGWDWTVTSPFTHSGSPSATNLYGATVLGLYYAYLHNPTVPLMTAMQAAATAMIADLTIRTSDDITFLLLFQDLPGRTPGIYQAAAKAKFDARIVAHTDATGLAVYSRDLRYGQGYSNGIIPWDIGAYVIAAEALKLRYPSNTPDYHQCAVDIAEVLYQDSFNNTPGYFKPTGGQNDGWDATWTNSNFWWYTLGISGLIDAFSSANVHTTEIPALVTLLLASRQTSGAAAGAFDGSYGNHATDEDWQSTAYAIRSLARIGGYQTAIDDACEFLVNSQDVPSGGWLYSGGTSYPEVVGEATAALSFGSNIITDPDPQTLTFGAGTKTVAVKYLGGGGGLLFGYSLQFDWDPTKVEVLSITEGPLLTTGAGTTIFATTELSVHPIHVDAARRNQTSGGVAGPGTMFTIEFRNVAPCGTSPIDLTLFKFRNSVNAELTGFIADDGLIKVDMTPPSISGVAITNPAVYAVTSTHEYTKDGDNLVLTATVSDAGDCGNPLSILADLSPLGGGIAVPPTTYIGYTAIWNFENKSKAPDPVIADGPKTILVSVVDQLGNTASGSDDITLDNLPPTPATNLYAHPKGYHTNLTWTAGSDAHFFKYIVKFNQPHEYPTFEHVSSYNYPDDVTIEGSDALSWVSPASTNDVMTDNLAHDMFYFRIYTMDLAANFTTDPSATERAMNYYLGDFNADGYIEAVDLGWFSMQYWKTTLVGDQKEADIGPTHGSIRSHSAGDRFGIPYPDGKVEFEDLMIFSMNYLNVAPKVMPSADASYSKQFALNMSSKSEGQDLVVSVKLENNRTSVKGSSLSLNFDPQVLKLKNIESGSLFGTVGSQAFFAHREDNGLVTFDAATMGTDRTVEYSGDIATLRFEVLGAGDPGLAFSSVKLRDGNNKEIPVRLKTSSANVPSSYALSQNYPNPFNPSSVIGYQVAETGTVTIDIYNALGAKVMTLVNGSHEAGSYQALLDASSLSSGLYYYTMRSGTFTATRSMTVAK